MGVSVTLNIRGAWPGRAYIRPVTIITELLFTVRTHHGGVEDATKTLKRYGLSRYNSRYNTSVRSCGYSWHRRFLDELFLQTLIQVD